MTALLENRRVLLVDDNPAIHDDIRKALLPRQAVDAEFASDDSFLFGGDQPASAEALPFELTSAYQGAEALEKVQQAAADEQPFSLAIVDMRMPPGWNGLETVERLWQTDPRLSVIFCTAYSDCTWQEMTERLGRTDRFVILKKPFENSELQQLVTAMTERWQAGREADANVRLLARLTQRNHLLEQQLQEINLQLAALAAIDGAMLDA